MQSAGLGSALCTRTVPTSDSSDTVKTLTHAFNAADPSGNLLLEAPSEWESGSTFVAHLVSLVFSNKAVICVTSLPIQFSSRRDLPALWPRVTAAVQRSDQQQPLQSRQRICANRFLIVSSPGLKVWKLQHRTSQGFYSLSLSNNKPAPAGLLTFNPPSLATKTACTLRVAWPVAGSSFGRTQRPGVLADQLAGSLLLTQLAPVPFALVVTPQVHCTVLSRRPRRRPHPFLHHLSQLPHVTRLGSRRSISPSA